MIKPKKTYKIALIGFRLSTGGSERVMANLSVFFEQQGIEVHNIIIEDGVSYPYGGKLINIGLIKNKRNDVFNKLKRLNALRKHLNSNQFDFIIDFRYRTKLLQELILSKFIYNATTIYTIHSYLIDHYIPNHSLMARFFYGNCYANVAITRKVEALIIEKHQFKNTVTIYNPVDLEIINSSKNDNIDIDFEFIIGIGQFVNDIKQFDKLILSFAQSMLPKSNIHLILLGDGDRKFYLQKICNDLKISDHVHFLGYQDNPYKYLKKSKFLVLSSKNEGMPNVILEALACEVPVVSFDCLSGPSEMIVHKENGLLVENQNTDQLSEAMNLFLRDQSLYHYCKGNTLASLEPFLIEKIGKQWLDLMQIKDSIH
jgi:N-acetylgalactosamine-N,N'-diacetylbacillosaminyl-diphospho-undecaprenol 4-alpha-N-acetylgalactosaminyltransferase